MKQRIYLAIDLKSFYASVECRDRGLDPMDALLVVADRSRTEKTICLAVSPGLKRYGIPGRPRLFEVEQKVREINACRLDGAPGRRFAGSSFLSSRLKDLPELALDYIAAPPRMARYLEISTRIYGIYLRYIAPEDIHVYSIDEVFMDVTDYLSVYKMTPRELAGKMIGDVFDATGITAAAGIGTNLYLAKVAMDIVAKKIPPDEKGVRIAWLDESAYRHTLWDHRPITDFWRVGRGYAGKLAKYGLFTMGDIARCSVGKMGSGYSEDLLYRMFGVTAELLIDHAWGWEPCTLKDIKSYRPETSSRGSGQVLHCPYDFAKARLAAREMAEELALDLAGHGLVTDQIVLTVGYDRENLRDPARREACGETALDHYGRRVPRHAHGTANLGSYTSSSGRIREALEELYDRIVNPALLVRRLSVTAGHVEREEAVFREEGRYEQLDLFTDYRALQEKRKEEEKERFREKKMQQAVLEIKHRYGKNAILKGMNLREGATARERNRQIGGHRA